MDDHPAVCEGLVLRFSQQPDLEVCGQAHDAAEALRLAHSARPDVIVLDLSLKDEDGIELIKKLRARHAEGKILVFSMHDENIYAERALRAGALGYVNKGQSTDQLLDAVRLVRDGNVHVSKQLSEQLLIRAVHGGEKTAHVSPMDSLSDRELEVFRHLGRGLHTRKIAQAMRVSPKTVETYRTRIKDKLKIGTATGLVVRAAQWVLEGG